MANNSGTDSKNTLYCSFCGKSQHEVRKLIAGPTVFICDECVELCMDIIREETKTTGLKSSDGVPQARAGVYNLVHDGGTNVKIASGQSVQVNKAQTAFAPEKPNPGEDPLQLLRETPVFLQQGGGLDALIQSLTIPMAPIMIR